jgi:hypothetical protein
MSDHKQNKLAIEYRYSMPIQWILDMLEDGKPELIKKFDVLNAQHELDVLFNGLGRITESDN